MAAKNSDPDPPVPDEAVLLMTQFSGHIQKVSAPTDKCLGLLLRSLMNSQLEQHESAITDLRRSFKLLADMKDVQTTVCYVRRCLVLALYKKQKLSQAEDVVREWLNQLYALSEDRKQPIAILERYLAIFQLSNGDRERGKRPQQAILDAEMRQLDEKLNNWIRDSMPGDQLTENILHPFRQMVNTKLLLDGSLLKAVESISSSSSSNPSNKTLDKSQDKDRTSGQQPQPDGDQKAAKKRTKTKDQENFRCTYCAISYETRGELTAHCQSESHQIVIMSDEGK